MSSRRLIAFTLAAGAAAVASIPLLAQQAATRSGPIARYDMRAATSTGMGGGGNPMAMMMGGGRGNNVQHELYLRLGTSRSPDRPPPKADHFMPPNAKLGRSVPLTTPREEPVPDEMPQKPRGRLLIFWGCGEHAPRGQPVVIDFARVAAGQMPPGMPASAVIRDWGPTLQNSRSFGRWPNEEGTKYVRSDSSLIGAHRVAGNYTPEIAFQLAKDFMAPLSIRTSAQPSGATLATWTGIPDATGYLLFVSGGKMGPNNQPQDMVMWTSSASRQFGGGLADWLTPAQVASLIRDRTVLPPTTTTCTVPAEVKLAAPDFRMGVLTAFGPMEEFSYPPRPATAPAGWSPDWIARIRHRSTTNWMEAQGMMMGGGYMDDDAAEAQQQAQQQQQQQQQECRPRRGLGGLLGGALGVPGC